ncbi:MAG: hypothetical protein KC502_16880, partial [Myxococcales bacterium]|nr:hypothetical protein [Myxococcales bacterium]
LNNHMRRVAAREHDVQQVTSHSAWARTDWLTAAAEDMSWIFVEGRFVARSVRWDGHAKQFSSARVERLATLKRAPWRAGRPSTSALVVGAGGGFDVAIALQEGADRVTAVELNPATIAFARRDGDRNGRIFERADVDVIVGEARRWAATEPVRFDHIQLALMETAPGGVRGRSTAHARLLTLEALAMWRQRLTDSGVLTLVFGDKARWALAISQLSRTHGDNWAGHVWAAALPQKPHQRGTQTRAHQPFSHVVLYSPTAWLPAEVARLGRFAAAAGAAVAALTEAQAGAARAPPSFTLAKAVTDNFIAKHPGARGHLHWLFAILASLLLAGLIGRKRASAGPRLAAGLAGFGLAWLQISVIQWVTAALGAPALALGLSIAAMLVGAAVGTLVNWHGRGLLAAGLFALVGALAMPPVAEFAAGKSHLLAALMMLSCVLLVSLPLGLPWLAALAKATAYGDDEGRIVAADGLGAVVGAGTSGLAIYVVGLQGSAIVGGLALAATALVLRSTPQRS